MLVVTLPGVLLERHTLLLRFLAWAQSHALSAQRRSVLRLTRRASPVLSGKGTLEAADGPRAGVSKKAQCRTRQAAQSGFVPRSVP
jgi:hypothetical protein